MENILFKNKDQWIKISLCQYEKNRCKRIIKIRSELIEKKYLKRIEEGKCIKINYFQ